MSILLSPATLHVADLDEPVRLLVEALGQLRRMRAILSDDSRCLTLFLRDLSAHEGPEAGRFAFCEQAPGASWYLCTVWHEWFATR